MVNRSKLFVLFSLLSGVLAQGQERYKDSVFTALTIKTLTYTDTLQLDVYQPKKDTILNRPLLVVVHGGGFSIGKRDNPLEREFCAQMAHRGYVVASISYRLTRRGKSFGCDCPAEEKIQTFKWATEDILSAVNFLTQENQDLGIDASKVVLIGSSAGAEAVLNTAFMRYHHDFKKLSFPEEKFVGVVAFSGAVLNIDYITKKTAVPVLMYHGEADKLVPFGTAAHHYCSEESVGYLILGGPSSIADRLEQLDTSYVLGFDPNGNHEWANKPYKRADEIAAFIRDVLLHDGFVQSKIRLD